MTTTSFSVLSGTAARIAFNSASAKKVLSTTRYDEIRPLNRVLTAPGERVPRCSRTAATMRPTAGTRLPARRPQRSGVPRA